MPEGHCAILPLVYKWSTERVEADTREDVGLSQQSAPMQPTNNTTGRLPLGNM